jgi:tetratricopeptide (TPR) repeat protein
MQDRSAQEFSRVKGLEARARGDRKAALEYFLCAAGNPDDLWAQYEVGVELLALERADEALTLFRAILAKSPTAVFGRHGLGLAARKCGFREEALEHFRFVAEQKPDNVWAQYDVAVELQSLERFDEALTAYRAVVEIDPAFQLGRHGLAHILRRLGDHTGALEQFRAFAALAPDNIFAQLDVGKELQALGQMDEAQSAYREIIARDPKFRHGRHGMALLMRSLGDHAAALEHFRAVLELDRQNVWASQDVAVELLALGRLDEAEENFRAAVKKNGKFSYAWHGLGQIARRRGDHEEALRRFRVAAELEPKKVETLQDIATELRELGRLSEADEILQSAVERNPHSARALLIYANWRKERASRDEFIALLEKAVALEPGHFRAKQDLAGAYFWRDRLDEAEAIYDELLHARDWRLSAMIGKGQVARRRGQRAAALAFFENAAAGPVPSDWAELELSRELFECGRFDEAERILRGGIARNPDFVQFHLQLGSNARTLGDSGAALAAFAKAAEIFPQDERIRIEIAIEEFRRGRPDQAMALLRTLIDERPRFAAAMEALANIFQQLDDPQSAIELRRRVLEIDGSSQWTDLLLAQNLVRLGEYKEAQDVLSACETRLGLSPEIERVRCDILRDRGDYRAARAALDAATARYPAHFELWSRRVSLLTAAGDFAEARRATEQPPEFSAREMARVSGLRGLIAEAEWKLDEAYFHHLDALKLNPADPFANDCAARVALLRLDVAAARQFLEASVQNNPAQWARRRGIPKALQSHLGQLVDEFRIDASALERLKAAMTLANREDPLACLVRENPDYTAAAISFLIALRQDGKLTARQEKKAAAAPTIPARITQFWDRNIPPDVEELCDSWQRLNPDFAYRRYGLDEARDFLSEASPPAVLAAFDRASEPAMKADIFRLALLHREGGWYADADDRCLAPIAPLGAEGHDLVVYREDLGTLGNNFIGVAAAHPAIDRALADAVVAVNRGDADMVWLATGPGLLTRSVASWLAENLRERLEATRVLERDELFDRLAIHCVTSYKHTKKHWSRSTFPGEAARKRNAAARALKHGTALHAAAKGVQG